MNEFGPQVDQQEVNPQELNRQDCNVQALQGQGEHPAPIQADAIQPGANKQEADKLEENDFKAIEHEANEHGANEHGAVEHGAVEHGANEHGANEHGANEHGANEHGANEHGANEHGANEHGANEHGANEYEADEHDTDELEDDEPEPDEFIDDAGDPDEELLDRLRDWLAEARRQSAEIDEAEGEPAEHLSPAADSHFGLYRLVEEFTALRHELKLQTKSARGLEEQSQTQLAGLRQAIEAFRAVESNEALAVWSAGKGLAGALADLDEALERGRSQIERSGKILIEEPTRALPVALDALFARQSWIMRLFYKRYHRRVRELAASHGRQEREALFAALVEGYGLIQRRLTRALAAERIERIATVGRPVDPERMIVVELVETSDQPPGMVVDEVRRGYTWNGRILRCAEVRAARSPPPSAPASVIGQ